MEKILFATSFGHEAIIKTILENKPFTELVLFEDDKENDKQKSSLQYIENITKLEKIKTTRLKIPLYNVKEIIKTISKELKKHKDKEFYFDISHGPRSQALTIILYLMLKYPKNVKKITYFNPSDNELVEYPLFRVAELSDKELGALEYIKENKMFLQKDLASRLDISAPHMSRVLEKLQEENFIFKDEGSWFLTEKAEIYLLSKKWKKE